MADNDLINVEEIESNLSSDVQVDSDLVTDSALSSQMDAVVEVSRIYTGVENEDIEVVVDNTDYTIEAILKKTIPQKTSDLTNDGDGTSPFATQDFVQDNIGTYTGIEKKSDYIYEVNYDFIDYDFANEYFQNRRPNINLGMCSSVRNGDFYGRNLDWLYNNDVEFKVNVKNTFGKNASFGIASTVRDGENALTKEFVESGAYSELYKILPFLIVDGQNQYGVTCNTNVVPRQKNNGSIINPSGTVEKTIQDLLKDGSLKKQSVADIRKKYIEFMKIIKNMD